DADDGRSTTRQKVFEDRRQPLPTEWQVEGIAPGLYELTLFDRARNAVRGFDSVQISANQLTRSVLRPPEIPVTGVITIGEKPAPAGTVVEFLGDSDRMATAKVDANGQYSVRVPKPGNYHLRVGPREHLAVLTRTVTVVNGPNRIDWSIEGGVIHVMTGRSD